MAMIEPNGAWISGVFLAAAAGLWLLHVYWQKRYALVRIDVERITQDVLHLAELQLDVYRKVAREVGSVEDRLHDLTLTAPDPSLPLERRYQVLRLSGHGMAPQQIAERLGMPSGEVELILNLKKFLDAAQARQARGRNGAPARNAGTAPAQEARASLG